MLYQRYFLKMNQSNMTNLISLLLLLCIGFLLFAATDIVMVHHSETDPPQEHSFRLDKLLVLICTSGCCIAIYGGKSCKNRKKRITIYKDQFFSSSVGGSVEACDERGVFNNHFLFYSSHISYIGGECLSVLLNVTSI